MKCPSPTGFRIPTNLFKPKGSGVTDGMQHEHEDIRERFSDLFEERHFDL
jgi:hypothetical protein